MQDLINAAKVFDMIIPEWLEDDTVVGKICGVIIHAGEVRRLSQGLEAAKVPDHDAVILDFLKLGRLIEAIKYRRSVSNDYLKEAKTYVEELGIRRGLMYRDSEGFAKRI